MEKNKDTQHNPNQTTQSPQAKSQPSCSLSSVPGETVETLVTSNGPFVNEKHVGAGLCSSKVSQKGFKRTLLQIAGHTTVRQNHGHDAGQEYRNAPTPVASMSKWSSVAVLHAVEKTFLVAQPVQFEEIPCRDVHLARCLQFAMHKFRLSLFVKIWNLAVVQHFVS